MQQRITVGVGDLGISGQAGVEIVTHSLGSCIAVVIHDGDAGVGGMLHLMLPDSSINADRAQRQPAVFADTGLPILFKKAYALGAKKGRLRTVLVGGAQIIGGAGHFNIGKRNYAAVRRMLYRNNVLVAAEEVGGTVNRTVRLDVTNGKVQVRINSQETIEL